MKVIPNYANSLLLFRQFFKNRLTSQTLNEKIKKVFDFYEDFIGIKEVKKTQESVLDIESKFVESSKARRKTQSEMIGLQEQLKQIRQKLDSTHRSDESYLPLITKEHQLIKSEIQMINSLRTLEENERDLFSQFSQKLRDAHEVERLRQERTKYLSVIGSIIGACLGIIATSINYALKRKDFNEIVKMIESQSLNNNSSSIADNSLSSESYPQNPTSNAISLAKVSTGTQTDNKNEGKIVEVITITQTDLEYKMKINSLTTVVATYALIAITLPIILRLFND